VPGRLWRPRGDHAGAGGSDAHRARRLDVVRPSGASPGGGRARGVGCGVGGGGVLGHHPRERPRRGEPVPHPLFGAGRGPRVDPRRARAAALGERADARHRGAHRLPAHVAAAVAVPAAAGAAIGPGGPAAAGHQPAGRRRQRRRRLRQPDPDDPVPLRGGPRAVPRGRGTAGAGASARRASEVARRPVIPGVGAPRRHGHRAGGGGGTRRRAEWPPADLGVVAGRIRRKRAPHVRPRRPHAGAAGGRGSGARRGRGVGHQRRRRPSVGSGAHPAVPGDLGRRLGGGVGHPAHSGGGPRPAHPTPGAFRLCGELDAHQALWELVYEREGVSVFRRVLPVEGEGASAS